MIKEENDPIRLFEQFKLLINEEGLTHQCLLEYLGISADETNPKSSEEDKLEKLILIIKENNYLTNKCKFREFLKTVFYICEMYSLNKEIYNKIESLIKTLGNEIKNTFDEKELSSVFCKCSSRHFLSFLKLENIKLDMRNSSNDYIINADREEPKIIKMIREDKLEEFISFVEFSNIDLNEKIRGKDILHYSKKRTLIEYSAIYGSIAIFKYLYMKNVKICNDIIYYAIQGKNYEIIHILENKKEIIEKLSKQDNRNKYLVLTIKLHYNEIYEYLIINYNYQITKESIALIISYRNYKLFDQLLERYQINFKDQAMVNRIFSVFCKNGNEEIVKVMINLPNLDINLKDMVFNHSI